MRATALAVAGMSILAVLGATGCASEVVRFPAELSGSESGATSYVVAKPADLVLDSGYQRRIESGTELVPFGSVRQGQVLRPTNAVLTVEGTHVHEAYLVVAEGRLVGFYLPFEKAFSPLTRAVHLSIEKREASK